jgi:hypothetical protein
MNSKINIDGKDYDLRFIEDRSRVLQILKDKMEFVENKDVIVAEGDFKVDY